MAMTIVQSLATEVLADLRAARREADLLAVTGRFARALGCAGHQLAPGPTCPLPDPSVLLSLGDFPDPWRRRYGREIDWMNDPVHALAAQRAGPVRWARAFAAARTPAERAAVDSVRAQGFRDGVTTPVHGPQGCVALFMIAAPRRLDLAPDDEEALSVVAITLYQRARRLAAAALFIPPDTPSLTARERDCLSWVLEGKTNWEIGVLTGVTARTVQFHLGNAARKMGVVNRTQAAVQALMRGEIAPPARGTEAPAPREAAPARSLSRKTCGADCRPSPATGA
jgi:DNA-binding CsgD family transcriptional regulator